MKSQRQTAQISVLSKTNGKYQEMSTGQTLHAFCVQFALVVGQVAISKHAELQQSIKPTKMTQWRMDGGGTSEMVDLKKLCESKLNIST